MAQKMARKERFYKKEKVNYITLRKGLIYMYHHWNFKILREIVLILFRYIRKRHKKDDRLFYVGFRKSVGILIRCQNYIWTCKTIVKVVKDKNQFSKVKNWNNIIKQYKPSKCYFFHNKNIKQKWWRLDPFWSLLTIFCLCCNAPRLLL